MKPENATLGLLYLMGARREGFQVMKSAATYIIIISVLFWTVFLYNFFAGMHRADIPAHASSEHTLT